MKLDYIILFYKTRTNIIINVWQWSYLNCVQSQLYCPFHRDTMDSVKQSAALCLLRLNRTSPDLVPMGEWTARVVHLLNDQHLVILHLKYPIYRSFFLCCVLIQAYSMNSRMLRHTPATDSFHCCCLVDATWRISTRTTAYGPPDSKTISSPHSLDY